MKLDNVLFEIKDLEQSIFRFIYSYFKMDDSYKKPMPTQMQIIVYILKHSDKEIYQKDLENVLNLRRATVSGVLSTMEKYNLITRVVDENDTRTKKIIINPEMKDGFKEYLKDIMKIESILTRNISKEEMDIFIKVVRQMKKNVEYTNN